MASIRPNDPRHPGPFRIEWKHTNKRDGEQERGSFTRDTYADAWQVKLDAERDIRDGRHPYDRYEIAPATREMTVGQWLELWSDARGVAESTARNQATYLGRHIIPTFGAVPLPDLTRLQVQRWVDRMVAAYSVRYVRTVYSILSTALLDAVDEPSAPIAATPCVRIRMPPPDPTGRRALSVDEVFALADRCGVHRLFVLTLAFTGFRFGDLAKRTRGDWNPFRQTITIAPKRRGRAGKTPAAVRTVGLPPTLGTDVGIYVRDHDAKTMFRGRFPRQVTYSAVHEAVVNAATAAGLDGVTMHWLRHTHRTWLREDGCKTPAIDERLGHKPQGMAGVYEHVTEPMRREVIDALEVRWQAGVPLRGESLG